MPLPEPPGAGPAWAPAAPEGLATAQGLAARLGGYVWWEQTLFEVLGAWVPDVAEAEVKLALGEHAEHAGWRARRWYEHVPPVLGETPRDDWCRPPDGAERVRAALEGAGGPARTLEKLAAAHRVVLTRLASAYAAHRGWTAPAVDAPVRRTLDMALADVAADVRAGEVLLDALVADADALDRVAATARGLEEALVAAGGLLGPGSAGRLRGPGTPADPTRRGRRGSPGGAS